MFLSFSKALRLPVLMTIACGAFAAIPASANVPDDDDIQIGRASYYADSRETRRTATGEYYDREAMTAAHADLPLGSWVKVTNLDTGRSVDVQINDRNAPSEDRIIDLSKAAAKAIGMVRAGLASVMVERIDGPSHRITTHEPPHKPGQTTVSN